MYSLFHHLSMTSPQSVWLFLRLFKWYNYPAITLQVLCYVLYNGLQCRLGLPHNATSICLVLLTICRKNEINKVKYVKCYSLLLTSYKELRFVLIVGLLLLEEAFQKF